VRHIPCARHIQPGIPPILLSVDEEAILIGASESIAKCLFYDFTNSRKTQEERGREKCLQKASKL
jgi:hypothetical protein